MGSCTRYTAPQHILIRVVMSTRRHCARPEHNRLEKTGSWPQGASRSHQPGQVRPPPRGLVRCERWQEVQEDSGGPGKPTLPTWKGQVSPLPSTVLAAAAPLATVSGLSPSLLLLPKNQVKSIHMGIPWRSSG